MNRTSKLFAMAAGALAASNAATWLLLIMSERTPAHETALCEAELENIEMERDSLQEELHSRTWSAAQREHPGPCATPTSSAPAHEAPQPNASLRAAFAAMKARSPVLSSEQLQFISRRRYGQLFEELALSQSQVDLLLTVLAQQEQRSAASRATEAGTDPRAASSARSDGADRERNQAEIAAAIGADTAAQFERLKQTLPARSELRQVRDQLEELGQPLSDKQYRELVATVSAQAPNPPPTAVTGEAPEVGIERLRTWFADRDRRFREASATILSPEQQRSLEQGASVRKAMSPAPSLALGRHVQAGSGG